MARLFFTTAGLSALFLAGAALHAEQGARRTSGEAPIALGLTARYQYHFNRNALRDSRRQGGALIALTESGNLLRFDIPTLGLTGEWFGPAAVTCLGRDEAQGMLVGLADGRVCRLDSRSFGLTEIARVAGKPSWIGMTASGGRAAPDLIVLTEHPRAVGEEDWPPPFSVVHHVSARWSYGLTRGASAAHLDGKRRLWLGGDDGEFGAWCACLDLDSGKLRPIPWVKADPNDEDEDWVGVHGFLELPEGRIWAYGGLEHMVTMHAFIRRVDRGKAESLYDSVVVIGDDFPDPNQPPPARPEHTIDRILAEPDRGGLLVFSGFGVYRTDPALRHWELVQKLEHSELPAAEILPEPPGGVIGATFDSGPIRIAGGKETTRPLKGQLGAEAVDRAESSAMGNLFLKIYEPDQGARPWVLEDGSWRTIERFPEAPPNDSSHHHLLVEPDGSVVTLTVTGAKTRALVTARWQPEKATILAREEVSGGYAPSGLFWAAFATPDGALWAADAGELKRLADGKWRTVTMMPGSERDVRGEHPYGPGFSVTEDPARKIGPRLNVVNPAGPPWILHDRRLGRLWRLSYGAANPNQDPRFERIPLAEARQTLLIHDALPAAPGTLLLATDLGLRSYEITSGKLFPAPWPAISHLVTALSRDGLGRLWLGGAGLAMIETERPTVHILDGLPMLGRTPILALAPDCDRRDGIVAALGERGVVFIQAVKTPRP